MTKTLILDLVITSASIAFTGALVAQIVRCVKRQSAKDISLVTCILYLYCAMAFGVCYSIMGLWFSTATAFVNLVLTVVITALRITLGIVNKQVIFKEKPDV